MKPLFPLTPVLTSTPFSFAPLFFPAASVTLEAKKEAEGLYDFPGDGDNQIAFSKGEILPMCKLSEQPGGGWIMVEKDGKKGIIPSNYVKVGRYTITAKRIPL